MSKKIEKKTMSNPRIKALMALPENSVCADCRSTNPDWASTTFGAFICLKCSGIHRSLGTHITLVRSCTLDSWPPNLLHVMESVGNKRLNEYYEANLPPNFKRPNGTDVNAMKEFITQKYVFEKFRPLDRSILPPHKSLNKMHSSASSPQGINNDFFAEETPKRQNAPQPKQGVRRSMNRSQSTDIDSAISGIVSNGPSSPGKSKIRLRHTRQAKETNVLKQLHKSSSSSLMETKQNPQMQQIQSSADAFDDSIDDFFADEKPHTIIPPRPAQRQKKVKIIQRPPTPPSEEEDNEETAPAAQEPVVEVDPLSKNMQLDFGSEDEPEDIDDFFNKEDDEEQHEIKELPPLAKLSTNPPPVKKPVLKAADDSANPFASAAQPQVQPSPVQAQKQSTYDDDAPNPFLGGNQSEPAAENQNAMPNIDDDEDRENIDDFFDDNPNKPIASQEPAKKKSTMQACGFVPSAEVYHPKNPDPPEFVQKMSAGIDTAKVKAAEAFSFVKGKLNSFINDVKGSQSNSTQNVQMPSSGSSRPMLSPQPAPVQPKPKPKVPEDEDIDAFFAEPRPQPVQTQPQTSHFRAESKGKAYKIHKRGAQQNKSSPSPSPSPSQASTASSQAPPSPSAGMRRQKQNIDKELSVDDAVELLLADTSSPSTKRRQRSNRH